MCKDRNETDTVFKVLTPSGVFAVGWWETEDEIPEQIADRFERYFYPRTQGEIVKVSRESVTGTERNN